MSQIKSCPRFPIPFKAHFNIILQSAHRFFSPLEVSFSFPHQSPVCISIHPVRATCPAHPILLDLIDVVTVGAEFKSWSYSLCSFLHNPVNSSTYGPNITLSTLFWNTRRPCCITHTKHSRWLRETWRGIPHTEVPSGLSTSGFEPDTLEEKSCVLQLSHVSSVGAYNNTELFVSPWNISKIRNKWTTKRSMVILTSIERETVKVFFKEKPAHIVALICR